MKSKTEQLRKLIVDKNISDEKVDPDVAAKNDADVAAADDDSVKNVDATTSDIVDTKASEKVDVKRDDEKISFESAVTYVLVRFILITSRLESVNIFLFLCWFVCLNWANKAGCFY